MKMRKQGFKTRDSSLAFFVNQLENLDRRLYLPLTSVTWGRDVKLRSGITMSDESTSFIQSTFAAPGTLNNSAPGSLPWISPETTAIPGVSVDGTKLVQPLRPLAREISFTSLELERSQKLGMPIDAQKTDALNTLYQMNTDQMVNIGAAEVNATGLFNNAAVTVGNVAAGAALSTLWINKTPDEILADVNALLESTWSAAAFAVCPPELRLPPFQYSLICSQKVSSAGNVSVLKYLEENSISLKINGKMLNIQPLKWLTGRGVGGADRMCAYTNEENRVRFPMVPIRREVSYYQGIRFFAPYLWLFGVMEFVYPETVQYADGI